MAIVFKSISSKFQFIFKNSNSRKLLNQTRFLNFKGDDVREILFAPVQVEKPKKLRKVSVIGATDNIGQACAFNLLVKSICDEIVLLDKTERKEKLCGEALDYLHSGSLSSHPNVKICLNGENTKDSDVIIVSGNNNEKIGNHLNFVHKQIETFKKLIPILASQSPDAVMLILCKPVDLMTYAAWKFSGFPRNRVIGSGTELDSSRFRYLIGKRLGISPSAINAWIIGEQGDHSVPCWSTVNVAGTRLREIDDNIGTEKDPDGWNSLHRQVVKSNYLIESMKGSTNWATSVTAENFVHAILGDKKTIHAVSTYCKGMHGIKTDAFLSLPVVLGNRGVCNVIKQKLDPAELKQLIHSSEVLDQLKESVTW